MDLGTAVEGEMAEDGGIEHGGEGMAPEGRNESESRLDISAICNMQYAICSIVV